MPDFGDGEADLPVIKGKFVPPVARKWADVDRNFFGTGEFRPLLLTWFLATGFPFFRPFLDLAIPPTTHASLRGLHSSATSWLEFGHFTSPISHFWSILTP